jgi:uncharacterized membrane protein YqjE
MQVNKRVDSTTDLAAGIIEDAERIVKLEIALAKQEAKELGLRNAVAIGMLAGAGLFAMLALLVALPVLIVNLFHLEWKWVASLVWLVLYLLIAAVLGLVGKSRLKIAPAETRTVTSLKENKDWALRVLRSRGK